MNIKNIIKKLQIENQALKYKALKHKSDLCAAGPWETYSDEMYEELKNDEGIVLSLWNDTSYTLMTRHWSNFSNKWYFSYETGTTFDPPKKIAKINKL